ncbi:hypothetical protein F3D10_11790, partial [Bacteroides ovatus]
MTTRRKFNVFLFILLLGVFSPLMAQSMSDSQVLEYVKDGIRQGKEQKQLASELARRGVTKEQATRVKQLYEQQNNVNASNATGTDVNESRLREEMKENTSNMLEDHPSTQDLARGNQVFGRNIFNTRNLTFEPSVNIATPLNYRLGPGDEVIIDIWGASQNTIRQHISPDGTINIQKIGPVNLNGLTIAEANDYLKKTLNKIYNGLNNANDPTSDIRLTLGSIRTIQINVMGEVVQPGTYSLSATRVKQLYEQQNNVNASNATGTDVNESRLREEMKENTSDMLEDHPSTQDLARGNQVFGRNIFNTRNLTFEPSVNIATPLNYRLGPGDEVIIDIWGASQNTIRQQISPDGTINIQKIGPVNLNGLTIAEANDYLKKTLNKIYNGLNNANDPTSDIRLTLGSIRTIQINVMGEVVQPGTYSLSSFATVFHALYRAGGVSDIGSLRNVQLVRNGKNIATIDVYQFIMKGNIQDDIRLQEGDVVIVPAYDVLVKIDGKVKRPMRFEMKKDESLSTLISYAGGFEADAYTRSLRVVRQNGQEYEVNTVKDLDYSVYKMRNGDVVTAEAILNRFINKLEIRGAVYRPGIYQLNGKLNTVRELVNEAQGLTGDAFLNRAVLYRQREDLTTEVVPVDIKAIMDGTSQNIILMKNDILYIPSIHDLEDRGNVVIHGEVAKPDSYPYADNMTLEDLIIQAGGLREAASVVRVDVSRRIKNPRSTVDNDTIGQIYTFSLKEGFIVDGTPGFVLQPYDEVYVRRSPGYQAQQNVVVEGEILFGGSYAMTSREERLSDLINKAGGAT